jgi:steroid delta-isomerase-like uncharacterized protein
MSEKELKQLVKDYVKAINSHDNDAIEGFHARGSVSVSSGEPGLQLDRAARRRYFQEREKAFPDAKMTVKNIKADPENGTVTFEWTIRATHKGSFKGMPPANKRVSMHGISELTTKNGKIIRESSYQDVASFMQMISPEGTGAGKKPLGVVSLGKG